MRILFVSSSSGSRGGGEIFLLYLAAALRELGHTVGLWVARDSRTDELAARFAELGDVVRADYTNTYSHWHRGLLPVSSAAERQQWCDSWTAWRPDVVHFNKQNLEDGLDLLAAADALSIPHLCTIHITQTARFLGARFAGLRDSRARRALARYESPLVAVAPTRTDDMVRFLGTNRRVHTVNNGVPLPDLAALDRASLRKQEGIAVETFAAVGVGRLEPQKQPLRFLDHASAICAAQPKARLRWIGDGRLGPVFRQEIERRGLNDTVEHIPWRNDVAAILPAYDLFLHSAAFEGLPLALLEAMAAAVPAAVEKTVHAQLPPALQSVAIPVDANTPWTGVLHDATALRARGLESRRAIEAGFSTRVMAKRYLDLYHGLLAAR